MHIFVKDLTQSLLVTQSLFIENEPLIFFQKSNFYHLYLCLLEARVNDCNTSGIKLA